MKKDKVGAASFSIRLENLTPEQLHNIVEHVERGPDHDIDFLEDGGRPWVIIEDDEEIRGYSVMETWQMHTYLAKLGIENIKWNRFY